MSITGCTPYDIGEKKTSFSNEEVFQINEEIKDIKIHLELFVVRNSSGQYFHNVGYGGYGKTWVDSLQKAKIYTKIGQARSRVTWFTKKYSNYPMPVIIKIIANEAIVLDESERVKKAIASKERAEARRKKAESEWKLKRAEEKLKEAVEEIKKLKDGC
jgi:hypothetical protein